MNAKVILVAGLLAATGWASNVALAQDDGAATVTDRMARMQGLMEDYDRAETPADRYELMQEHFALMQAEMADMQSTMMAQFAEGETPDMTAMHEHMGMMQGMMTQMMGQQGMMMRMQGPQEQPAAEDGEAHEEHHEDQ